MSTAKPDVAPRATAQPSEAAPRAATVSARDERGRSLPEEDAEFSAAPETERSSDDEFVEQHSAWNVYLHPFLTENWLGLVGVTSLMAAWMFLTLWLWDKGYRIGTNAVPLLGLTLATAWISRFIERLPDVAPRAVNLGHL
ncbi:MAG: hypothetical protein GKR94_13125 [Gammaproteobacteria bacterium]|nr:hypothetical protein [Gammaproteobacteria bacterium]